MSLFLFLFLLNMIFALQFPSTCVRVWCYKVYPLGDTLPIPNASLDFLGVHFGNWRWVISNITIQGLLPYSHKGVHFLTLGWHNRRVHFVATQPRDESRYVLSIFRWAQTIFGQTSPRFWHGHLFCTQLWVLGCSRKFSPSKN